MKVEYANERTICELGNACSGDIICPTNSQTLYLVTDTNAGTGLFDTSRDYRITNLVSNPQAIEYECEYEATHWRALIVVIRVFDGELCFMPSETKVEIMNCTLRVEGE